MLRILVVIILSTLLAGCYGSSQVGQEIRSTIEAGRVTNWHAPSLHKLEQALFVCDQPILAKGHGSGCAARADEAAVFAEAMFDCAGLALPMCLRVRGMIAAGPTAFVQRIARFTAYDEGEVFRWYQPPHNPMLASLFSVDDRLALLQIAIRRHAVVLGMLALLIGAAWWLTDRYRRRLEQDELIIVDHKAELARIRLSEQRLEAEAAQSRERARNLELRAIERRLELEKYRDQRQYEQRETERRQHLSIERERILRMFGEID